MTAEEKEMMMDWDTLLLQIGRAEKRSTGTKLTPCQVALLAIHLSNPIGYLMEELEEKKQGQKTQ